MTTGVYIGTEGQILFFHLQKCRYEQEIRRRPYNIYDISVFKEEKKLSFQHQSDQIKGCRSDWGV